MEISHTVLSTDAETHKQIRVKISLQQCIKTTTEGTNTTQTEPDLVCNSAEASKHFVFRSLVSLKICTLKRI